MFAIFSCSAATASLAAWACDWASASRAVRSSVDGAAARVSIWARRAAISSA
ncbi:hypothetical protein [Cereibacter changlensis]|uniref:hypothetical protein n=1 Tax=Cereibacter changlensis TaxID=402884 RepID=UPI004033CB7C